MNLFDAPGKKRLKLTNDDKKRMRKEKITSRVASITFDNVMRRVNERGFTKYAYSIFDPKNVKEISESMKLQDWTKKDEEFYKDMLHSGKIEVARESGDILHLEGVTASGEEIVLWFHYPLDAMKRKEKRDAEKKERRSRPERIKLHGFTVINGGLSDREMKRVLVPIDKLFRRMKQKRFDHLFYGLLVLVPDKFDKTELYDEAASRYRDINPTAYYYNSTDSIAVNVDHFLKDSYNGMGTLAHELGHREWFKFFDSRQRKEWTADYEERLGRIKAAHINYIVHAMFVSTPSFDFDKRFKDWARFDYKKFLRIIKSKQDGYNMLDALDTLVKFYMDRGFVKSKNIKTARREYVYDLIGSDKNGKVWAHGGLHWCAKHYPMLSRYAAGGLTKDELPHGLQRDPMMEYKYCEEQLSKADDVISIAPSNFIGKPMKPMVSTTDYGQTNTKEDFAEAFEAYITNKQMPRSVYEKFMRVTGVRKASRRIANRMIRFASIAEKEAEKLFTVFLPHSPFKNIVHAVGGYVRDEFLGRESKDLDLVIEMDGGSKKLTEYMYREFSPNISRPIRKGNYPIWAVIFKGDVEYRGKVYKTKGAEIEIADTMKEQFPDETSRQRETQYGTLEEDMERRDLTINMLIKDLTTGKVRDITNKSIDHLTRGVLDHVSEKKLERSLRDDPLRMLRLIRFQCKYGWDIPLHVMRIVKRNAKRIEIISSERIVGEMEKVTSIGKLGQFVKLMKVVGLLKYVLPEIDIMRGVVHSPEREYHKEGDVYKHTLLVLKNSKPTFEAQMAALLHDVGKPSVQKWIGNHCNFHGHEKVGGEIAEAIMRRLKMKRSDIKRIRTLVEQHMKPFSLDSPRSMRRFIRKVGDDMVEKILDLAEADALGNLPPNNYIPGLRKKIRNLQQAAPVKKETVLSGNEVMDILDISPGIEVGRAMKWLEEKQDDYAADMKVLTKAKAKQLLRNEYVS